MFLTKIAPAFVFCVVYFRDILFTLGDMGYLRKLIMRIFISLLKGIWDTCLIGYR